MTRATSLRTAEVIAVGSELLGATRLDTNSLYIAERFGALGIQLSAKTVVGDDLERIADACRAALARADVVVLTGGLGPTGDDLTREAVAAVLGVPLVEDPAIVARIGARFARRGLHMPDSNRRQAQVIAGARPLDNPNGTAPGQLIDYGEKIIVLLPGPPRELRPMVDDLCDRVLAGRSGGARILRATLYVAGRSESHVDEAAQPIYSRWRDAPLPIDTTILASPGQIELHLSLRSTDVAEGERLLREARAELETALGDDVFSTDGRSMEQVVGSLLRERGLWLAAAESCTGGLLLSRLTDVPGSSAYVLGGAVVYSNALKTGLAEVPPALIAEHGAVSEPVAAALAHGIQRRTGADVAIGITGVAGPAGGSAEKPVGTVAIAVLAGPGGLRVRTFHFVGGRALVKQFATQSALDMVRRALLAAR